MSLNFRRRVKIAPGINLNLSKSGLSLNLGVPGFNTTLGKNRKSTIGLPGTGLSYQFHHGKDQKAKEKNGKNTESRNFEEDNVAVEKTDNIISVSPELLDSGELSVINDLYTQILDTEKKLNQELARSEKEKKALEKKILILKIFLVGFLPSVNEPILESINFYENRLAEIKEDQINNKLDINYTIEDDINDSYLKLIDSFNEVKGMNKIWDVNRVESNDKVATRSLAAYSIKRISTSFSNDSISRIICSEQCMKLVNKNGADIYLYPSFIVFYEGGKRFSAIGYDKVEITYTLTKFIEEDPLPKDAEVVDHTWKKVNKNGSRDKRFKGNYEIPVVVYGEFTMKVGESLHEIFQFSNHRAGQNFYDLLSAYQAEIDCII